jgi:hypothetical protein
MVKTGMDPNQARLMAGLIQGESGTDFNAGMGGVLKQQEFTNRETLGDPNAPLGDQFASGQGVQGRVLPRYETMGTGMYTDVTKPDLGVQASTLGEAMIGSDNALTNLRNVQAGDPDYSTVSGGGGPGGVKPETGYMANPNFDPSQPASSENPMVVPVPGGSKDPNTGAPLGTRERQVVNRVINAALNTATDLETINAMEAGSDQGFLGTGLGASPGISVMDAIAGDMKRTIASDEVIKYNAILGGFSKQLLTMEQMGMQGAAGLAAQYDTLAFTPQDTIETKMFKLAGVKQIVENATETILATPNMPDAMRAVAQNALDTVRKAVPYTRQDVIDLQQAQRKNPKATLKDVIGQRRSLPPVSQPGAPAAAPAAGGEQLPTFATEAEADAAGLTPGTRVIIGGVTGTWN